MTPITLTHATITFPQQTLPSAATATNLLDDLQSVIDTYQLRIFRFLLLSLRDRDLAETLTQETFLKAWANRSAFRGDCSLATWLTRIALNLLRDHTRTERFRFWKRASANSVDAAHVAAHLPHPTASAEAQLIAAQQVALIWQTVATLTERQRTIFVLRFIDDLDLAEIAAITSLPIGTVKTHLYRATAIIRASHNNSSRKPGTSKDPK